MDSERCVEFIARPPLQLAANATGSIVVDSISAGEIVDVAAPVAEGAAETKRQGVGYRTREAQRRALLVVAGGFDVAKVGERVRRRLGRDIDQAGGSGFAEQRALRAVQH